MQPSRFSIGSRSTLTKIAVNRGVPRPAPKGRGLRSYRLVYVRRSRGAPPGAFPVSYESLC